MMASSTLTRVACFLTLSLHANAFIVGCGSRLYDQRIDAIVNPGTPSGHVHTVMGGNGMNFTMSATLANDATCSTCEIQQDLSNYWTPKMYYYNMTTGQFVVVSAPGSETMNVVDVHEICRFPNLATGLPRAKAIFLVKRLTTSNGGGETTTTYSPPSQPDSA